MITGVLMCLAFTASASESYREAREATYVVKDFQFQSGETLPEVKLHYRTMGNPDGEPVVILHGTNQTGATLLNLKSFSDELFAEGKPLDAEKYFLIFPDSIGHGGSSKPSDGLKAKFPKYTSEDMVDGQYRLLTEGLGLDRVHLILGISMGGMHTFQWGGKYPDYMDALVPVGAQPIEMSARNWMLRRLLIESVRQDPTYNGGDYTEQPKGMKLANVFYSTATNGGTIAYQKLAPTREAADQMINARLAAPLSTDANDYIYAWESSASYNPTPLLGSIKAPLLLINAEDDERNPTETGASQKAMEMIPSGREAIIPQSENTRGHNTIGMANFYADEIRNFLRDVAKK